MKDEVGVLIHSGRTIAYFDLVKDEEDNEVFKRHIQNLIIFIRYKKDDNDFSEIYVALVKK
jgi:hypothetical protein